MSDSSSHLTPEGNIRWPLSLASSCDAQARVDVQTVWLLLVSRSCHRQRPARVTITTPTIFGRRPRNNLLSKPMVLPPW